ncbi:hypothetical protein Pelo_7157 [Pelomyxa schiedti]|nr:hypothetical protein Pelo_7157 [Pelomyxa schiedti]
MMVKIILGLIPLSSILGISSELLDVMPLVETYDTIEIQLVQFLDKSQCLMRGELPENLRAYIDSYSLHLPPRTALTQAELQIILEFLHIELKGSNAVDLLFLMPDADEYQRHTWRADSENGVRKLCGNRTLIVDEPSLPSNSMKIISVIFAMKQCTHKAIHGSNPKKGCKEHCIEVM